MHYFKFILVLKFFIFFTLIDVIVKMFLVKIPVNSTKKQTRNLKLTIN